MKASTREGSKDRLFIHIHFIVKMNFVDYYMFCSLTNFSLIPGLEKGKWGWVRQAWVGDRLAWARVKFECEKHQYCFPISITNGWEEEVDRKITGQGRSRPTVARPILIIYNSK